jgi:hypothetical protein
MMVRFDEEDPNGAPVSVRDRDSESAARVRRGPAESETPCTHRNSRRENRETQSLSAAEELRAGGRKR